MQMTWTRHIRVGFAVAVLAALLALSPLAGARGTALRSQSDGPGPCCAAALSQ